MTYKKPNIDILGKATVVIEQIYPKPFGAVDGIHSLFHASPAYDLDD
jgi:hypothetical protein